MAEKSKFWRTVVHIEILSEGQSPPDSSELSPFNLGAEILTGDWSGEVKVMSQDELEPLEMANALRAQGSEPEFLGLNDEGKILEDDS